MIGLAGRVEKGNWPSRSRRLRAGVFSTIIVASALLLLLLAGVLWLWESDFLLFSRTNYQRVQLANIQSTFTLYRTDPSILERLDVDSTYQLYDSLPGSRMKITRQQWGLYEAVSVASIDGRIHSTQLMAASRPGIDYGTFWYRDNNGSLTLSGRTNLHGKVYLPRNGVIYGQMQSVFFHGEKLNPADIKRSETEIPVPSSRSVDIIRALFELQGEELKADSLRVEFYATPPFVGSLGSDTLSGCSFSGHVIIRGDKLHFDASYRLTDIIVVARSVSVGDGFRGRLQVFASDTVVIGKRVEMHFPSGVYCERYAELGDDSVLEGYMVVDCSDKPDVKNPNMRKSRSSRLRGLLYVNGIAMLQGIVTGAAVFSESVYYSSRGYYRHMLYDASVLDSPDIGYPLWLETPPQRKEAVWVQ